MEKFRCSFPLLGSGVCLQLLAECNAPTSEQRVIIQAELFRHVPSTSRIPDNSHDLSTLNMRLIVQSTEVSVD